jgi:hypothetical protein
MIQLGFTLADAGNWISRFKLDFLAIQRLSGTEKCAITYAEAGTGSGYANIDCMGLRIETDSFTTNLYTVSKNYSQTSTALFSYTPQQGETLGVEFVKVSLTEFRVSIYTEDFLTLIESQTVTGSNVQYATALDTFVVGNSNQSGTEPSTVQTIAVRDIKVKFDQAIMLESKQNYCHLTDSTVQDTFTKTHTTDSVLARGVHHFTDSVVVGPAPPITHTTDSIVQQSDIELFHTTDIYIKWSVKHTTDSLFLGKQTEVHTTDSVFKGAVTTNHTTDSFLADNATTVTVSHTTDSILKEINKERTHLTDSVLALRVPITHTTDSYLVGAFLTHTTDSHLAYVSEPFHKTDSILKAILPVTHTTDSFVADRPLVTHTTDSVLKILDQELTQTTDSYLNATKSVTHDTDSIVKQLTQLTHTTDSSLTGAVVVNHTTDSFLKSVTLPEAPEIQVSIRSIGDIQVGIMSDGDIQTYLNSIGDIEVYG